MKQIKPRTSTGLQPEDILPDESILVPKVKKKKKVKPHKRVNTTILGGVERAAINWILPRLPAWVTPDILTGIGLFAGILIFFSYWASNRNPAFLWLASLGFLINWFGDSLDGNLARYRHIERPKYGYYIDHIIDAIVETLVFLGAGLSPYLHFNLAALALIGYFLLSVHVFMSTYITGEFRISYASLGPTEMRALVIVTNIALFFFGMPVFKVSGFAFTVFDVVAVIMAILFAGAFLTASWKTAVVLAKAEGTPKPVDEP